MEPAGRVRRRRPSGPGWTGRRVPSTWTSATGLYLRLTGPRRRPAAGPSARGTAAGGARADLRLGGRDPDTGREPAERDGQQQLQALPGSLDPPSRILGPGDLGHQRPGAGAGFRSQHGRLVYKSASGVRSIVHELTPGGPATLDRVRHLPTQFQRLVTGTNVRVHVVGGERSPARSSPDTIDYRYREGGRSGADASGRPAAPKSRTAAGRWRPRWTCRWPASTCWRDVDGRVVVLRGQPVAGVQLFAEPTGLPIAAALARWLRAGTMIRW